MNIKEIAELAGVSPSTVSKIMNHKDETISSETRERVLKIVKEYNYTPYASAKTPTQKSWIIGILLPSQLCNDAFLDGIISTAQEHGYTVLVRSSCSDTEQELKSITALCSNHVDGIIWEPLNNESLSHVHHIQDNDIPLIQFGPYAGRNALQLPYETYGYQLTSELLSMRHTDVACLSMRNPYADKFISGYQKCLFDNHLPMDDKLIFYELDKTLIYKINTHQISGIIASHYQRALEFYQLMNTLHYRIPEDFSLISLKNDGIESPSIPEISTYTIPTRNFGMFLCKKLIFNIEKRKDALHPFTQKIILDNLATVDVPFSLKIPKIVVVGSINLDTYLNVPQLPDTGKTVSTSTSSTYPGGKGINQAIGTAKLGHQVSLIGNVGSDIESDTIYRTLADYGVDTSGIKRCINSNTGKAYIFVESGGNSMISILAGANNIFTPENIRENEHLFQNTGYCLIQSEIPVETVLEACKAAHRHNVKTILKPSACDHFPEELLSCVDIIIPNEDELKVLCPDSPSLESRAETLLGYGIKIVITTLGERGCFVKTKKWEETFPAASFTAVDSTGASDAFICTLASYLLYGYTLKEAVRIATYAAGFCVSREGVVPSLADKNTLESYIDQKDPGLIHPHTY